MKDLQLSFTLDTDGRYTVAATVVFDRPTEALLFNEHLVEICKSAIEDSLPSESASETADHDGEGK